MPALCARLTIDLDAVAHNHAAVRAEAAGAEVAPVVKADGYGLGDVAVARRLMREGARTFFAARLEEGERLRAALGPSPAIYLLDGCPQGAAGRLAAADIRPVLNSLEQVAAWGAGKAALHVDTGMNRLGLRLEEAAALKRDGALARLDIDLLVSHLACGDEPGHPLNAVQLERFHQTRALFPGIRSSLCNSGGSFLGPDYRFDLVRPGIALYGGGPEGRPDPRLRAVATFEAPILQVRDARPGESVGYGASHTFASPARIAVVAAGYADGILRISSPGGFAWFDGARRAFLGRVSMDLIAIDVTGCEAARPGAMVELLGEHVPLDVAAAAAGTAAYECITRLGTRGDRIYLGAEA